MSSTHSWTVELYSTYSRSYTIPHGLASCAVTMLPPEGTVYTNIIIFKQPTELIFLGISAGCCKGVSWIHGKRERWSSLLCSGTLSGLNSSGDCWVSFQSNTTLHQAHMRNQRFTLTLEWLVHTHTDTHIWKCTIDTNGSTMLAKLNKKIPQSRMFSCTHLNNFTKECCLLSTVA